MSEKQMTLTKRSELGRYWWAALSFNSKDNPVPRRPSILIGYPTRDEAYCAGRILHEAETAGQIIRYLEIIKPRIDSGELRVITGQDDVALALEHIETDASRQVLAQSE
jgi:hypothetical protein